MATSQKSTEKDDDEKNSSPSASSSTTEVAQDQADRVAIVSRTSTGEPAQSPGYKVVGLPEKPTEAQKAAAENRPEKG